MEQDTRGILDEATPEELLSCIQLLAISVVQHRAKCGFVTLKNSTEPLRSVPAEDEDTGLYVQSKQVLEEALEIVRTMAGQSSPKPAAPAPSIDAATDLRTQLRIKIATPIKVLWPQDTRPVNARLEDISWGGAALHVDETRSDFGDTLQVILPRQQGGSISIEAKILRVWPHPDGAGHRIAIRFSKLSTRDEAKLEEILEHLARSADEDGQRGHARLTQRLEIQFDGEQELLSTLDDISGGGLGITVPDPVQIGQSLQIVIGTLDNSCHLKLRARVVRQEKIRMRAVDVYRVGLKFEHPTEELKRRTGELIARMASTKTR
jgi:c-di-GMP-binding flagellar brake protein YcgR